MQTLTTRLFIYPLFEKINYRLTFALFKAVRITPR